MATSKLTPFNGQLDNKPAGLKPFDGTLDGEKPVATKTDRAKDMGLALARGIVSVPEAVVGLADIPTGGRVGKFLENEGGAIGFRPRQAKEFLSEFDSAAFKDEKRRFAEADGLVDKTVTAVTNPALVANTVAESLPSMFAGGAAARAAGKAAGVGQAAMAGNTGRALAAGGEGAMMAGMQASEIRGETEDGLLTPKQSALAAATGVAGGAIGFGGAKLASKLGVGDVDQMIASGMATGTAKSGLGMASRAGRGALAEGVFEELPQTLTETGLQNIALDRPFTEGMQDAAVLGTLAGGVMGAGGGVISGFGQQRNPGQTPANPGQTPPATPVNEDSTGQNPGQAPLQLGYSPLAGTPVIYPDGTVALDGEQQFAKRNPKPSEAMGLNPAAGPLSAAAAQAVDSGASPVVQSSQTTAPPAAVRQADALPAPDLSARSTEELRTALRNAQDPNIRKAVAAELSKRKREEAAAMPDPLADPATRGTGTGLQTQEGVRWTPEREAMARSILNKVEFGIETGAGVKQIADGLRSELGMLESDAARENFVRSAATKFGLVIPENQTQREMLDEQAAERREMRENRHPLIGKDAAEPGSKDITKLPSVEFHDKYNEVQKRWWAAGGHDGKDKALQQEFAAVSKEAQARNKQMNRLKKEAEAKIGGPSKDGANPNRLPFTAKNAADPATEKETRVPQAPQAQQASQEEPQAPAAQPAGELKKPRGILAKKAERDAKKGAADVSRTAEGLRPDTGTSTGAGGNQPGAGVATDVGAVRGRGNDAADAEPAAQGDAGQRPASASTGSPSLTPSNFTGAATGRMGSMTRATAGPGFTASDVTRNVQNAPQGTDGTLTNEGTIPEAAAVEAPAPARGDGAAAAGVPATPGAGDVQADGVTSSVDSIAQAINASIADGAIKKNSKFYAEKVAKGYMTQEEADRRAAADAKPWSEQKPTDRTLKLAKAIADKDPTVLVGAWANEGQGTYGNEGSMEAFRKLTGINLKRLNSADRAKAIFDWAGWSEDQVRADVEKRKAAKAEAAAAYEATEAAERAERTEKQADKTPLRVQGKDGETTVKAYVDDLIAQGYTDIGQTQKGAVKQVLLFNPKTNSGYPMPKGILADYAKQAVEKAKASKAAQQPAEGAKSEPFEHAGLKIHPSRVKEGDQVVDRWVVQSPENAEREARGERQIGGDRIVETREQAIKTAEQEAKRHAKEKADRADIDAQDKARRDAAEAKKESNRGKTLLERRADAILDKPGKFPASAGLGLGTKREAMDKAIEQGRLVTEVMVDDAAAKKRDRDAVDAVRIAGYILGASNENIPVVKKGLEAQARLKEGKYQKPEYRVYQGSDRNGSFFEITKTEYDYVQKVKATPPAESKPDQEAGPEPRRNNDAAPASSRDGQIRLANRGSRIATLKMLNNQLMKLDPNAAWSEAAIEGAADGELDSLQDAISSALMAAQRGEQGGKAAEESELRAELEALSGAELRAIFDRMGLAGSRMTATERVNALMAEDAAEVRAAMNGLESPTDQETKTKEEPQKPTPPKATELTPKQFHDAKLAYIAADTGADMAEVREMYDTEGGRADHQREWLRDVEAAAKAGETLTRQTLDKLYELAPTARLPETATPTGYQRTEARKAEAEEKQARIDNRKAAKESVKAGAAQEFTAADAKAAERQLAQMIGDRIDAMQAQAVQKIGAKFLPTMGIKAPIGKAKIKAAVTDFTKVNPLAAASEFGVEIADSVRAPLLAQFEGRLVDAAKPAAPAQQEAQQAADDRAKPEPVAPIAAKVDDFGEKLPPARRAMAAKLSEELTDDAIASQPLSKVWPLEENEAIEDTFAAAVAHVMREAVPAKPRTSYKVKSWVSKVKLLRDFAAKVMRGAVTKEKLIGEMEKVYSLRDLASKIKLLEQIDREQWKRIGDVSEAPGAIQYVDGKAVPQPSASVTVDGRSHWFRNSGDINAHVDAIKAMLTGDAPESKLKFEVYRATTGDRKVFISKKGDKEYRRLMEFDTVEEARKAIKDQYADLVAAWEGVKSRDNITERDLRTAENRPRTGKDHRKGRDISAEEFQQTFGFRGGEFGKWVSQGSGAQERQFMLNSAYDALMDLSDIIGVPPKAISLDGTLGVAFGSRGGGWASAHFEPSNLVINLTKPRGAGALAHEWFHALDNYFARKRGGEVPIGRSLDAQNEYRRNNFITHKTRPMMVRKDGKGSPVTRERLAEWRKSSPGSAYLNEDQWIEDPNHKPGVRAEVEERFDELVKALDASPMLKRARKIDGVKLGDGYWSRTLERAARAFENYIQVRMHEQGYNNDFLVNVKPAVDVGKSLDRYPYLLPSEVAPIADAFSNLFNTIQTRETDGGNVEMFSIAEETASAYADQKKFPALFEAVAGRQLPGTALQNKPGTKRILTEKNLAGYRKNDSGLPLFKMDDQQGGFPSIDGSFFDEQRAKPEPKQAATNKRDAEVIAKSLAERHGAPSGMHAQAVQAFAERLNRQRSRPVEMRAVSPGTGERGKTAKTIQAVARKLFNRDVVFVRFTNGDPLFNGAVSQSAPGKVFINIDSPRPMMAVLGHELLHELRKSDEAGYQALRSRLDALLADSSHPIYARILEQKYQKAGMKNLPRDIAEELYADIVGDHFTEPEFWQALTEAGNQQPAAWKRVLNKVLAWLESIGKKLGRIKSTNDGDVMLTVAQQADGKRPFGTGAFITDVEASRQAVLDAIKGFDGRQAKGVDGDVKLSAARGTNRAMPENQAPGPQVDAQQGATQGNAVTFTESVDPNTLVFREEYQNRTGAIRADFPDGVYPPLVAIKEPSGELLILDGHNRAAVAKEDGYTVDVVTISRSMYDKLSGRFDDMEIAYAALYDADQLDAASNLNNQFPGAGVADNGDKALSEIWNDQSAPDTGGAKDSADIRFSIADARDNLSQVMPQKVMDLYADATTSQRGFNRWWHRTVGTQLHKAKINKDFGRVFYSVQDFMRDVSRMATIAADKAPTLLTQIETMGDVGKAIPLLTNPKRMKERKANLKAASDALFDGTLKFTRDANGKPVEAMDAQDGGLVWTKAELKERGLSDEAIKMYREGRAAIDQSLDNMLAADIYRVITTMDPEMLVKTPDDWTELTDRVRKLAASEKPMDAVNATTAAMRERAAELENEIKILRNMADEAEGDEAVFLNAATVDPQEKLTKLRDEMNRIGEKVQRIIDLKKAGYAPLMRFGEYAVSAYDETGQRVYFGLYESQFAANRAARKFNEQGLRTDKSVMSKQEFEQLKGLSPETAMLFAEMLGVEKNEAMQTWLKNAVAEQSALKRHIRRKGVSGFDDDSSRVLAAFLTSNSRAASRALHSYRIEEAVANVRQGDVKDEAIKLADYVNNPKEEAQAVRSLLFVNYIGGSVSSALVNLTQTFVQTYPFLSQYGGAVKAGKRVGDAMRLAFTKKVSDPELAEAIKQAENDGVIKPQEVFQLQAEASRTLGSNLYARTGLALWGSFFQMAEVYNRRTAFIAAYQTAKQEGIKNPFAFAENAVNETQGIFNKGNRPNWSRGAIGATLFTFKTFTIQYVEFLKRMPPKQRAIGLAVLFLMAGAGGFPFAEDAEDVIDTVAQAMGYNFTSKTARDEFLRSTLGDGWATFIQSGVSPWTPFDVSQRLGMADLLPGTAILKKSETRKDDQALEIFGVAGSFVRDALKGEVRPIAFRNAAKAIEMYDMGIYRDSRGRKVIETDPLDAVFKSIGLQPANVAAESRKVGMQYEKRALYEKVRNEITEQMALGQFENDPDKVQNAREAVRKWNEKNPEAPIFINMQNVWRRVREMNTDRTARFLKSTPKELRAQIQQVIQ